MNFSKLLEKAFSGYVTEDKKERRDYFILYTISFAVVALIIFYWFWGRGYALIWKEDGYETHLRAFVYLGQYMREFLHTLFFEHRFSFPDWEYALGEGGDIMQSLHYYGIGDIFVLPAVLVPSEYMYHYFNFVVVLKIYISGVFFSCLCMETGKFQKTGILAGALSYAFCFWSLYNANRHSMFLNPVVYLPLLILGVERIVRGKKPWLLAWAVALSAASNFYFFYMLVLMVVIYVAIRLIFHHGKNIREMLQDLLRIGAASVVGAMISGVILCPVLYVFLGDTRFTGDTHPFYLVYNTGYYKNLLKILMDSETEKWLVMGFSIPVVLALVLILTDKRREALFLRIIMLAGLVVILLPALGKIFNGFSYTSNRCSFGLAIICCYVLTLEWDRLTALNKKQLLCLLGVGAAGLIYLKFSYTGNERLTIRFVIIFAALAMCKLLEKKEELCRLFMLLLTAVSICLTGTWYYSPLTYGKNSAKTALTFKSIERNYLANEPEAIETAMEDTGDEASFIRYAGRDLHYNVSVTSGVSAVNYCWNISNPNVFRFRKEMMMREGRINCYEGYDDRTELLTLAGVNYFTTLSDDDAPLPVGFVPLKEGAVAGDEPVAGSAAFAVAPETSSKGDKDDGITKAGGEKYRVYKNSLALPLAYSYDRVIPEGAFKAADPSVKQSLMMSGVYLEDQGYTPVEDGFVESLSEQELSELEGSNISIPFEAVPGDNVKLLDENRINSDKNGQYKLEFEPVSDVELYVQLEGLDYNSRKNYNKFGYRYLQMQTGDTTSTVYAIASDGTRKGTVYMTDDYSFSSGRKDYILNLGYMEGPCDSITLQFSKKGTYKLDNIRIIAREMDTYPQRVAKLKGQGAEDIKLLDNSMEIKATVDDPSVLCVAMPYSKGWTAFVDGERTQLYIANLRYMGIELSPGSHEIKLIYKRPFAAAGMLMSIAGLVIFAAALVMDKKKLKKEA